MLFHILTHPLMLGPATMLQKVKHSLSLASVSIESIQGPEREHQCWEKAANQYGRNLEPSTVVCRRKGCEF